MRKKKKVFAAIHKGYKIGRDFNFADGYFHAVRVMNGEKI